VRLMLTLTPVVCVCGGMVVSEILTTYLDLRRPTWAGGEDSTADVSKRQKSQPVETNGTSLQVTFSDRHFSSRV
jgi:hypothetical protein